jgi:hypothetical protein
MAKNHTRKRRAYEWAMKRPWRVTYRNRNGNKTQQILKTGRHKDSLLKKLDKKCTYIYGVNNLTDTQIKYYERQGLL